MRRDVEKRVESVLVLLKYSGEQSEQKAITVGQW